MRNGSKKRSLRFSSFSCFSLRHDRSVTVNAGDCDRALFDLSAAGRVLRERQRAKHERQDGRENQAHVRIENESLSVVCFTL